MVHEHGGLLTGIFDELYHHVLGLPEEASEILVHFSADLIRIFVLFTVIYVTVSYLQTFVGFQKIISRINTKRGIPSYLVCGAIGMISPFCSCTIAPVFMGLVYAGIPIELAFTILASSTMINIVSLVSIATTMGMQFMLVYLLAGYLVAAAAGLIIGKTKMKVQIRKQNGDGDGCDCHHHHHDCHHHHLSGRLHTALHNTSHAFKGIWLYLVIGVALSSIISYYATTIDLSGILHLNKLVLLLAALGIGSLLHTETIAVIPLVQTMLANGMSTGVAVSFMLATVAVSFPLYIMLTKVVNGKSILKYFGIVLALLLVVGLVIF